MLNKPRDATPEEIKEWMDKDYFISMKFDPLQLFVVIPTLIQVTVLAAMGISFLAIGMFF